VPGLYLWGFLTPTVAGALFLAALVASCFLGALPPVDLLAVCLVRAMLLVPVLSEKVCCSCLWKWTVEVDSVKVYCGGGVQGWTVELDCVAVVVDCQSDL
jgi:ABC-type sugar transport system permease subunit